eukprot:12921562-Prorocentrum_lima.AAC.1
MLEGRLPAAPRDVLVYLFHTSADPPSLNQTDYGKQRSTMDYPVENTWASAIGDDIVSAPAADPSSDGEFAHDP